MTLETVLTGPNGLKTYPNGGRLPLHSPLLEYKFALELLTLNLPIQHDRRYQL